MTQGAPTRSLQDRSGRDQTIGSSTDAALSTVDVDGGERLVCAVAQALHEAGAPAHRLEDTLEALSHRLDLQARVFSTPTALTTSFGAPEQARTVLLRVQPGALDLGQLAEVDAICRRLLDGEINADQALLALKIAEGRTRWGPGFLVPAFGASGMAATVLLGGSVGDLVAAGLVGVIVGLAVLASADRPRIGALTDLVAGLLAALAAGSWARGVMPVDPGLVTVASLIVLVPGLTLTTAVTELASRHLVSGTARLAGAFVTFSSLGLGALLGSFAMAALPMPEVDPIVLPEWTVWPAWAVACLAFIPLMQARIKDLPLIALSTLVGLVTLRVVGTSLPPALAAAAAALAVGLVSNGLARALDRPAAVPLVPGLFLLVPGSIGFRSLVELLDADLQAGLDHAIAALITAAALAAGVIVSQAIITPRRAL